MFWVTVIKSPNSTSFSAGYHSAMSPGPSVQTTKLRSPAVVSESAPEWQTPLAVAVPSISICTAPSKSWVPVPLISRLPARAKTPASVRLIKVDPPRPAKPFTSQR